MESGTFKQPIFLRDDGFVLRRIDCVMDAIEFLEEWPVERRGLLHAAASETCCSAYDGGKSVEAAHKTFRTWARRVGVIEDVPVAPSWMTGPKIGADHSVETDA
ncbi:MAG: DUF982 domain-containing protein [Mesorhizobium sp.]|nr:MAG: DUF982 domain-containing protein [Mesorhizobium sp.]